MPTRNPAVGAPRKTFHYGANSAGHRQIIPELLERATLKFQDVTQHLYSTVPQEVLAQVQSDEVLVAAKGRREVGATSRGDRTSP